MIRDGARDERQGDEVAQVHRAIGGRRVDARLIGLPVLVVGERADRIGSGIGSSDAPGATPRIPAGPPPPPVECTDPFRSLPSRDTIRDPKLRDSGELMLFDRVIANPPFSLDEWGREVAEHDTEQGEHGQALALAELHEGEVIEFSFAEVVPSVLKASDIALDVLDTFVNAEKQFPPHDTVGWPTYGDWPSWGGQTHHQTYYVWLQRAWMGGLRLMVNHFVANEELCQLWPVRQYDCNEMESIQLQYDMVHELQDYLDAQMGGPGEGFFRIVTSSADARRVIEGGRLAVVLGTENEKVFDCGEYLDSPLCTREHIDEQLEQWHAKGIRAIFPIHLLDNAFGGTRLTDDPALSGLYQTASTVATGHPYATIPCEDVDARAPQGDTPVDEGRGIFDTLLLQVFGPPPLPPATGCVDNARGLTELGDYFVNAMVDHGIMIETDHTGTIARRRMFDIAAARNVPVLSGHTGEVSDFKDSRRILEVGGVISNLPDEPSPVTVAFIHDLVDLYREVHGSTDGLGTGFGSDINGIHNPPPPRADAAQNPLVYPFKSWDGRVTFERQVTGERVFDLNIDGVAHYGLYPDFIADMQMQPGGPEALQYVFRSAEAYLQAWARAEAARTAAGR